MGVFLTGVQHLKLYSITRRNILKDNLTITRAAADTVDLDDVKIDLLRSPQNFEDVTKMWIQNDDYNKIHRSQKSPSQVA